MTRLSLACIISVAACSALVIILVSNPEKPSSAQLLGKQKSKMAEKSTASPNAAAPKKTAPDNHLTDVDGNKRIDLNQLAKDVGASDDREFFLNGVKLLIRETSRLQPWGRQTQIWGIVVKELRTKGGAPRLIAFMEPMADELLPLMQEIEDIGCTTLCDLLFSGVMSAKPGDLDFAPKNPAIKNQIEQLKNYDYMVAWKRTYLALGFEATMKPEDIIVAFKSIDDTQVRGGVERLALAAMAMSDHRTATNYFLSDQCLAKTDSSLALNILSDYLKEDPEGASTAIRDAPRSERRDWAISVLLKSIRGLDKQAEDAWLNEVGSEEVLKHMQRYNEIAAARDAKCGVTKPVSQ